MWTIVIPSLLRNVTFLSLMLEDIYALPYLGSTEVILIVDKNASEENRRRVASLELPIRIVHSEFSGPGVLRNEGISLASGDYISFFDDDDRVDKTGAAFSFQADITLLGFQHHSIIFDNKNILTNLIREGVSKTGHMIDIAAGVEYVFSYCQPFAFSKSLLRRFAFYDARVMEDIDFISHILASNEHFAICEDLSYRYIHHDGSTKALSGEDIYKSAEEISSRIQSLSDKFESVMYFQLVRRYSIAVRRARFFEAYKDRLCDNAAGLELGLTLPENWMVDLSFWEAEFELLHNNSQIVGIYCKNNLSACLFSCVKAKHKYVIDDRASSFDAADSHIITFPNFLMNCDGESTVFVAHAHPRLLSETKRIVSARCSAFTTNVRSLLRA